MSQQSCSRQLSAPLRPLNKSDVWLSHLLSSTFFKSAPDWSGLRLSKWVKNTLIPQTRGLWLTVCSYRIDLWLACKRDAKMVKKKNNFQIYLCWSDSSFKTRCVLLGGFHDSRLAVSGRCREKSRQLSTMYILVIQLDDCQATGCVISLLQLACTARSERMSRIQNGVFLAPPISSGNQK